MGFDCKTINWILYMFFCSVNVHTILEKSGQLCGVLFVTMIIRLAAWFEEIFGIHRVWCINMGLVHNRGPLSQSHCSAKIWIIEIGSKMFCNSWFGIRTENNQIDKSFFFNECPLLFFIYWLWCKIDELNCERIFLQHGSSK
jgi:hypothetical protein